MSQRTVPRLIASKGNFSLAEDAEGTNVFKERSISMPRTTDNEDIPAGWKFRPPRKKTVISFLYSKKGVAYGYGMSHLSAV